MSGVGSKPFFGGKPVVGETVSDQIKHKPACVSHKGGLVKLVRLL